MLSIGGGWRRWLRAALVLGTLLVTSPARAGEPPPALLFDATAGSLPREEIRAAVEKELGALAVSPTAANRTITVLVDPERGLIVRYQTATGTVERALPMPSNREDVPLIVSLAAGNLARDQSGAAAPEDPPPVIVKTLPEDEPAKSADDEPARSAPPPPPVFRRHWLGLHVAQDIAIVGGSNVCDANLGQMSDNYACFYEGTDDEPFWHTPYPYEDGVDTAPVLATTRVLFSYEFAAAPSVTLGTRVGLAFRGGPPAGQEPTIAPENANLNNLPEHTKGKGGSPFMPVHLELRASFWFLPLDRGPVSAYVGFAGGAAQVDSKTTVQERDCAHTLEPGWDPNNGSFDECRQGDPNMNWKALGAVPIDAWKKMGQGFGALTLGAMAKVSTNLGVVFNLDVMYLAPASGIVFEPSLGMAAGL